MEDSTDVIKKEKDGKMYDNISIHIILQSLHQDNHVVLCYTKSVFRPKTVLILLGFWT